MKSTQKPEQKVAKGKNIKLRNLIISIVVMFSLLACVILLTSWESLEKGTLSYNEFFSEVKNGNIESVTYTAGQSSIEVTYKEGVAQEEVFDPDTKEVKELKIKDNKRIETVINPSDDTFFKEIASYDVDIYIRSTSGISLLLMILSVLPMCILIGLFIFMMKLQFGGSMGKKPVVAVQTKVLFSDVAGMTEEKEELLFAIKSLQKREEYLDKGVKAVRGILLEGPPGVGKTLLAKAVAGEAGVNFLSYSGSDFVEMFAGLGARRIRSMYESAEKLKPCVVFIDEIDALGRTRISGGNGGTQEADQTLVALLERMDGMNTTSGILFIGATNRLDALDSALLRPGRFDKIIHVGPPKTKEDREAIVRVHSRDKSFAEGVTVEKIAKQCYGLTGAEIASALNDAVLESFKSERAGNISLDDIDKAIMKLFAKGLAKGRHSVNDRYRVAVHEAGHAIMNNHLGRSVVKVSIQPYSSGVGGVTMVDGESDGVDGLRTKTDIINDISVLFSGKVAEECLLGECSIGASNDLERATFLLRDYIGAYGMSDKSILSLVGLSRENVLISANDSLLADMEETAKVIYAGVVEFFKIPSIKAGVEKIAKQLVEEEVIYDLSILKEIEVASEDKK